MQINNCDKYGTSKDYMKQHERCKVTQTEYIRQGEKLCLNEDCSSNNYINLTLTTGGLIAAIKGGQFNVVNGKED